MKDKLIDFKEWIQGDKKRMYIFALGIIGLVLLLFNQPFSSKDKEPTFIVKDEPTEENISQDTDYKGDVAEVEEKYEQDLVTMLNKIKGISEVEVMVNVDSTHVQVYEKDVITSKQQTEEQDKSGGLREVADDSKETRLVTVREGEREKPLLVQTKKPEIRGVFITAKGIEQASVKKNIIDAVAKVLGVSTYRISIIEK
ncbi:MAG TPA: stage III sporulation protein AG [Pseudogracilibacillus sp.]|nr:stage III sporulation protein AG [Pseudogracilibacillus sp.]